MRNTRRQTLTAWCDADRPGDLHAWAVSVRKLGAGELLGVVDDPAALSDAQDSVFDSVVAREPTNAQVAARIAECARGDWILCLETDEVPDRGLRSALNRALNDPAVDVWRLPRRWLWPDPSHVLAEEPWASDCPARLVRRTSRDGAELREAALSAGVTTTALLHSDLSERLAQVLRNEMARFPELSSLRGHSAQVLEPERYSDGEPRPLGLSHRLRLRRRVRGIVRSPVTTAVPPATRQERPTAELPSSSIPARTPGVMIPRIVHRIWLGDAPVPTEHARYAESWVHHHPGWEHRLWTDATVPHPPGLERARNVAERADLIRYEILRRHGGLYVDTDVEALRPIEPLIDGYAVFSGYESPGFICNAVVGAVPGHRAMDEAVRLAEVTVGTGIYPYATATAFLTFVLEREPEAALFPPHVFYPTLWNGESNVGTEAPYTAHHWAHSWG